MELNIFGFGAISAFILASICLSGCIVDANESCVGEDDCFQDIPAECFDYDSCGGWVNDIPEPDEFQVDRNISDAGVDGE